MRRPKRSSTSSSERVAIAFLLALSATAFVPKGPFRDDGPVNPYGEEATWSPRREPPDDDYYFAYDDFSLDHYVLYFGLEGTKAPMQSADVLLAGVSLVPFAFPRDVLEASETLRYYCIGFGHKETAEFTQRLIETHDLSPKYVVVNVQYFFDGDLSEFGRSVVRGSAWDARKHVFEKTTAQHLPFEHLRIPTRNRPGGWAMVLYRSRTYGSWFAAHEKPFALDVPDTPNGPVPLVTVPPERVARARKFQRFLAERGSELVLTEIPSSSDWLDLRSQAASLANELEVPFVSPASRGLKTRDEEHLDDESGRIFAAAFLAEFAAVLSQ